MAETVHNDRASVLHTARLKEYPGGQWELLTASAPVFHAPGWESAGAWKSGLPRSVDTSDKRDTKSEGNAERAMRRAAAQLRDIALCTSFRYFLTLTISPDKLDRHNDTEVLRKLNIWAQNAVQRQHIAYALVPERHKDGAIHFHGFVTAGLALVDSGTVKLPGRKKPVRPRPGMDMTGAKTVWNVPGWTWGFSTALELDGEYSAAVAYVCKYVRKQAEKIGGRWFYRGGSLGRPRVSYADIDYREHEAAAADAYAFRAGGTAYLLSRGERSVEKCDFYGDIDGRALHFGDE